MHRTAGRVALAAAALGAAAGEASAGAFMIREGSARTLGSAMAGRTAGDDDVSLALHNPASLRGVDNFAASLGAAGIFGSGEGDVGSGAPGVPPLDRRSDPNQAAVVPSLALGWRASEDLVLGFAFDSPFGLATEYDDDFVGAFDGVRSELITLTATPMAAYDVVDGFTLGAGVSVQYAYAELSQRFASGEVSDVSGDGVAWGVTVGAIVEPTTTTRIGVNFQSGFDHDLEGDFGSGYVVPTGLPAPFPPALDFSGDTGRAAFELPALLSVGVRQEITDDLRLLAEVEWSQWSRFDDIVITNTDKDVVIDDDQNYENSFFVALGAEYDATEALTVRAGVAYDETPTTDADRTVRVPDGERLWLSAGLSYALTERVSVDAAYTYINVFDTSVRLDRGPSAGRRVDYQDSQVHVVGLNVGYRF